MAFGAIDCPARGIDDFRKILRGLEEELSGAKARRDKILLLDALPQLLMPAINASGLRRAV